MIYVCSLAKVGETVERTGARRVISLLAEGTPMERPAGIAAADHLYVTMHDIAAPQEGLTPPGEAHVRRLLDFGQSWDRKEPLVVHCFAGISRSTATAYLLAAAHAPDRDELELAQTLRRLSPTATPNPRIIALADGLLGRNGRMISAIASIGRGAEAMEGVPFALAIDR